LRQSVSGLISVTSGHIPPRKMAAPFSNCTIVEERAVIIFWSEGAKRYDVCRKVLALCNKCKGLVFKEVLSLPDKALPHSAAATVGAIRQLNFKLPPHPSRSGPSIIGLSHMWTTNRNLAWTKICK
jgi:hypothetical protein